MAGLSNLKNCQVQISLTLETCGGGDAVRTHVLEQNMMYSITMSEDSRVHGKKLTIYFKQ